MDVTAADLVGEDGSEEPPAPAPSPDPAPASPEDTPPLIPYRSRRRRWLRRAAKTAAGLFVTATFVSTAYNAATDARASVPAGIDTDRGTGQHAIRAPVLRGESAICDHRVGRIELSEPGRG